MKEIKFYIKRQYGRDDMYLYDGSEPNKVFLNAFLKITGKRRNINSEIGINHDEMNGLEGLGFKFIQVPMPIKK